MEVREMNVKFHKNCENTGKILKIWHSLSRAPIRKFLWCYYRWLITFLALEKCKKRMRYCLNYSGTIKVFVHWKLKLLNFLISCFDMTSRRPYLCTEQWIGGHVCVQLFSHVRLRANATTPNIVAPTMLEVVACVLAVVCKRMQQLPTMLGPTVQPIRNGRAWPQQCWKSCPNGSNIVALRFGDHGTKEMLGVVGWKVWPVSNFAQQHATGCANGRNM